MTEPTPAPPTITPTAPLSRAARLRQGAARFQSGLGLAATLILAALVSPTRDGANIFLQPSNLLNVVRFASENGIIAVGMTLVILTGGIDLSVGAVLALCAVVAAACLMQYHLGVTLTILIVLGLGGLCGVLNGVVTTKLKVQSFITTLAMMSAARGVASLVSGGYAIPLAYGTEQGMASPVFKSLFAGEVALGSLAVPTPLFYFVGVGALASLLLHQTGWGRHVYAVGGNERAARLSGVATDRVRQSVFALSGLLAGLAALLHAGLVNQGSHIDGSGYELNAIAAVVIGGTRLSGGAGSVWGTMMGALILSILDNILGLRNLSSEYQMILKGIIIVLAVIIQRQQRTGG